MLWSGQRTDGSDACGEGSVTVSILPQVAIVFILMFARLGSMIMLLPGLGETSVPVRVRLVFALAMTLLLYPVVSGLYPQGLAAVPPLIMTLLFGEIAVGLFLGLAARLVLAATQVAGTTVANQVGLGFANSIDPNQGQQGVIIGNLLSMLAVTLILVTDLHHIAIGGLVQSFETFKPGQWMPVEDVAQAGVMMIASSFAVGVQLAAPFLAFGIIFSLGLGILAKLMPQFQIFFISMPLSILLGLVLMALVLLPMMVWYLDHVEAAFTRLFGG